MLNESCAEDGNGSTSFAVELIVIIVLTVILLIAIVVAVACFVKVYRAKKKVASRQEQTQLREPNV